MCKLYALIDEKCKQRKTNVTQMCKQLDIPRSTLSELKAERTKSLTTEILCKIADYLECSTDYLLGRTGDVTTDDDVTKDSQSAALLAIFDELDPIKRSKLLVYADELKNKG